MEKTATAGMMNKVQRKMSNIRCEISKIFTKYEGFVNVKLGNITREVQDIIESPETSKLNEKIQEMEKIKCVVEGCLKNLDHYKPPSSHDLESQSSASKGKGKAAWEYALKFKSPQLEKKLQQILEDAANKSKEEEFNHLSMQLKMCLLCFSIFPMDAEIEKRVLIYWWIGEGFVTAKNGKTSEEVGEVCFQDLVNRRFIQPVYNWHRGNILRCKMHPWVRWMIIKLARKEDFFNLDESGMPSLSPSKSRHACIISTNEAGLLEEEYSPNLKEDSLLTLFNVNVSRLKLNFSIETLPKLKTLVVLHLGSWRRLTYDHMCFKEPKNEDNDSHYVEILGTQLFNKLGALVHLRYLSLRGISRITKLPSSIRALRNLEILDLRGCQNLEKLTDEIKWLERLTHLDVSHCYMLEYLPNGIGLLLELRVLKGFVFGGYKSRNPCKLADLASLKKLSKLSISFGSWVDDHNVDLQDLSNIKGLKSLAITWNVALFTVGLKFPASLMKLDLRCFPKSDEPSWLNPNELPSLEKLYIRGGKLAKLGLEGNWNIKMLRLKFLKDLYLETTGNQEWLRQLECLEIHGCPNVNIKVSHQHVSDGVWVKEKDADFLTKRFAGSSCDF